ncbi:MAG: hypothetical protein HYR96_11340 [Deltaproteobacteria bacterium]|nr:hypothetical protein [Deltaproteobacteria bacterium]MBI3293275.1 hypothetical protein [Deltaproteobacteria bacterium]
MKINIWSLLFLAGCAHHSTSEQAREKLDSRWEDEIGKATKSELIEDFGNPEWCRSDDLGVESCRFYRSKGRKWLGEKKMEKSHYSTFDEILVDFDSSGKLKTFKANAQR